MIVLAVDPGVANCGYALGSETKLMKCGTLYTRSDQGTVDMRIAYLIDRVVEIMNGANMVLIEQYRVYNNSRKQLHMTIEFIGALKERLRSRGIPYEEVPYRSWNSWFARVKEDIPDGYRKALESGSVHQKDAIRMLVGYFYGKFHPGGNRYGRRKA